MTYFDDFEYFVTFSFIMDSEGIRFAPVPSTVDLVYVMTDVTKSEPHDEIR